MAAAGNSTSSEEDQSGTSPASDEIENADFAPHAEPSTPSRNTRSYFEPIRSGDRDELTRIASRSQSLRSTPSKALSRKDTLAGVELGDDTLDPTSPRFDPYKWARMMLRLLDEKGVKHRRAGYVFKDLSVSGSGSALNLQDTVTSILMAPFRLREVFAHGREKKILRDFDGVVKAGELLVVLGRPGSGCSTLLKSLMGEVHGLKLDKKSVIHYNGIPQETMLKSFKGEVVYNQEVDKHFPHLTVGQTLEFAAAARASQRRPGDVTRKEWAKTVTQVMMAVFGLSHTYNTMVGNEYVRGVSGGERKRVSIAEMALAGSPLAAWDNSTRGLDSATALEFVRSLRMSTTLNASSHTVAIYQASQAIYDLFDKAIVLYEGRQVFFGPVAAARPYFESMGWYCPPRQTTADFLTAVTNAGERKVRDGFDRRVPRTAEEFERYWKASPDYRALLDEIEQHERDFPVGGEVVNQFKESHHEMQARHVRPDSPYTISLPMQIKLCTTRAYQRLWNDRSYTLSNIIGKIVMALIISSVYFGTRDDSNSFFSKGAVIFFAILSNALSAITEITTLYDQRPIVEKQASYAFYHPFAEALAGIVSDIPVKFAVAVGFNIILYFLAGLRRDAGAFFVFFLFTFIATLAMSGVFRTLAAATKTVSQALAMAGVLVLAIVIYTGFTIPRPYMHGWFKWISWINPVAYAFEALLVNEISGRNFPCGSIVPSYPGLEGDTFICPTIGAVAGEAFVSGDAWLEESYGYSYSHTWRNFGILCAFTIAFMIGYLAATELNSFTSATAEVLVFRRGHVPKYIMQAEEQATKTDAESKATPAAAEAEKHAEQTDEVAVLAPQKDIFSWRNVCYDITIKGEPRRLLDNVSGWVKPGTLTALMGVSGAGKTTLLNVLAQRTSVGVVTGDMLVSGKPLDSSFQRKTGYVQQQDLHLETTTVREALRFSAMLRQPPSVSKKEKYDFVEDVIKMLSMEVFAEAVVGNPGEGLNVEQRKLLTIGVELAAKPALLLFLDEPTSGLDSQSSWAIVAFLRKLADNGQAVLSTIHQPSAILFQEFDRLLFLARGGRTVYFGDIGENSRTLLEYFEENGARRCGDSENPAEYILEIGNGTSGRSTDEWHESWKSSEMSRQIHAELDRLEQTSSDQRESESDDEQRGEFAMPFGTQLLVTTIRVFQQYWRTPSYIWSKLLLGVMSAVFIGFTFFQADESQQGLQNVLFSVFMITSIFSTLVQQVRLTLGGMFLLLLLTSSKIMPRFVTQRSLYEVRERPSKAYSWVAFLAANIIVEIPYQILLGILVFASFYYPVFGIQDSERQGLILLFVIQFFVFASTFAHMLIAALPDAETAGNIASLLFTLTLVFNGVLQPPSALPGFWIFMYRVSPLTYLVAGITGTGLHARPVNCSAAELSVFQPPAGQSCGEYMQPYLQQAPGNLINPAATSDCSFCPVSNGDQFLASVAVSYSDRWTNYGIGFAYIIFNVAATIGLYYAFRVKNWSISSAKRSLSILLYRVHVVLYWVRGLFAKHREKTPLGLEATNSRVF